MTNSYCDLTERTKVFLTRRDAAQQHLDGDGGQDNAHEPFKGDQAALADEPAHVARNGQQRQRIPEQRTKRTFCESNQLLGLLTMVVLC